MAETFKQRNAIYGDNWKRVGAVMTAMFPEGVVLKTAEDFNRWHLFELIVVKMTRFANSGLTHTDSIHDPSVYGAMIEAQINTTTTPVMGAIDIAPKEGNGPELPLPLDPKDILPFDKELVLAEELGKTALEYEEDGNDNLAKECKQAKETIEMLVDMINQANRALRKCHEAAERSGVNTDWDALSKCVGGALRRQHKVAFQQKEVAK